MTDTPHDRVRSLEVPEGVGGKTVHSDSLSHWPDNGKPQNGKPARGLTALERRMLERLMQVIGSPALALQVWSGETVHQTSGASAVRLHIQDRPTLWKLLLDPVYQFGNAYADGRLHIDGGLIDLLMTLYQGIDHGERKRGLWTDRFWRWWQRPRENSLSGSHQNINHHYDIGNEFYRLWLDEQLLYTCAYFPRPDCTLEQAQIAKMDHVARKLQLRPGERVMEAGCGWGALALHLARHYGVKVRAWNISREQIQYARQRVQREGLADRVEYIEDDWRSMTGRCEAFVSVGMLEHVGRQNYRQLSDVIHRCLRRGGRGLIHTIGQNRPRGMDRWIERHIFPGAYPPALSEMMEVFEPHDFSVLDVENLRLHYAQTLEHWLDRFEGHRERIRAMFDERFVRMWRLYLSGSLASFATGGLQLFQVIFARDQNNGIPRTRAYQYSDSDEALAAGWPAPGEPSTWTPATS